MQVKAVNHDHGLITKYPHSVVVFEKTFNATVVESYWHVSFSCDLSTAGLQIDKWTLCIL